MSTKRKLPAKFATPNVKAKQATRTPSKQIQTEARAVVGHGALDQESPSAQLKETPMIEISSDEEEEDDLSEDEQNFEANGDDTEMGEVDAEEDKEAAEPSFGDLVLATSAEPINVKDAFAPDAKSSKKALAMPSGASLGVVLTQALKTNDLALLESCLQTSDLATIRATIQRLDAPLASTLLSLLAARLARRPGRAGSLMVWIQWTLVTHGGYLATQPSLIAKMAELNRIVEERARGLSGLLALKGKLDLLDAQMMLRRSVRDARGREEEESDDEDVIYVEGEEELEEDSEDEVPGVKLSNGDSKKARKIREKFEDSEGSESEDMPDTFEGQMDIDSEEDSDDDEGGMIDDEAESTDDDEGDSEEEVDFEEQDEDVEDSEEDAATVGAQTPGRTPKGKGRRN